MKILFNVADTAVTLRISSGDIPHTSRSDSFTPEFSNIKWSSNFRRYLQCVTFPYRCQHISYILALILIDSAVRSNRTTATRYPTPSPLQVVIPTASHALSSSRIRATFSDTDFPGPMKYRPDVLARRLPSTFAHLSGLVTLLVAGLKFAHSCTL